MQTVGKTSSGKLIKATKQPLEEIEILEETLIGFTTEDLFEAFCLMEALAGRYIIIHKDEEWAYAFKEIGQIIKRKLGDYLLEHLKIKYKVLNSTQICRLGKSFLAVEFID